jgi:MOSC domain-containing protein YiiM
VGDPLFPRRFLESGRTGFYLRVLQEGEMGAGDALELVERSDALTVGGLWYLVLVDKGNVGARDGSCAARRLPVSSAGTGKSGSARKSHASSESRTGHRRCDPRC